MAYVSHVEQGFANLYSFHSWVGALTLLMMTVNILGGMCGTMWRRAQKVLGGDRHRMMGLLTLGLAFASVTLGFAEYQTFIVRDKGPWSAAAIFASILASITCLLGTCYVVELVMGTSTVTCRVCRNSRTLVPTGNKAGNGSDEGDASDDVPVIYYVDVETREISSGSGTSS